MSNVLRFIGINKDARTAGPGRRLELFTKGCIRGVVSPCKHCFNEATWTFEGKFKEYKVKDLVEMIARDSWNRQVTFCGGEPMLQARNIMKVAKKLKKIDPTFHIIMYTMYKLDVLLEHGLSFTWYKDRHGDAMFDHLLGYSRGYSIIRIAADDKKEKSFIDLTMSDLKPTIVKFQILSKEDVRKLLKYIDIIVDGEYKHELRMTTHETMHDGGFIGSSNQRVIFCKDTLLSNKLIYMQADDYMASYGRFNHCKTCGHIVNRSSDFCNDICEERFRRRKYITEVS